MKSLLVLLAGLSTLLGACQADRPASGVEIVDAWSRSTPPNATVGVVYLTIRNRTHVADELLTASTPLASKVEMHATQVSDGVSSMHHRMSVALPVASDVKFEPGALHFMLIGLHKPLAAGERFPLTLQFAKSGSITVDVSIRNPGE